jgi:plastocyanin
MNNKLITKNFRLVPSDSEFLNRKIGFKGEIFYDESNGSLRVFDGNAQGGVGIAKSDLSNVSNADFIAKATDANVGGAGVNSFSNIAVSGQSNVVADTANDTLTLASANGIALSTNDTTDTVTISAQINSFSTIQVAGQSDIEATQFDDTLLIAAGSNMTITTDASTKTVTFASVGGGGASDSFSIIAVSGQNNLVADSPTDILTLVAGTGISITTNSGSDTITITNTGSAGSTNFNSLTDATSAGITIDEIALPAITVLNVTNAGASAYLFDQYSGNNPTIYAIGGTTIAFKLNVTGHPFLIQNAIGNNYNIGLIHVSTTGTVLTGASAQGQVSGTLYWKVPASISGGYRYQCSIHAPMVGSISVKNIVSI